MGFFLPSETARLVLSYLLEQKFQQTGEQFMGECPHIQELKLLPKEQLRHHTKINGRTLMDVLKEYAGLTNGITNLASEVSHDEFENLQFEPPLRVLKTLGQILQSKASSSVAPVEKKTAATQTSQPAKAGKAISTQTAPCGSPNRPKKPVNKAVISQNGSCQTNLNLVNFTPPIPKIIQSKEVQTDSPVMESSSIQTQTAANFVQDSQHGTQSVDVSPVKTNPLVLNFQDIEQSQPAANSQTTARPISVSPPKTNVPFFHSNIRVLPRQGFVPILPKPGSVPVGPPIPVSKKKKGNLKKSSTAGCSLISGTPVSENNFQSRLLAGENSHSTPSQGVKVKDSRKLKPKKNKDSDEEFLNELLGIGDKIASLIPKNITAQNISDIADKGLDNPGLMETLLNVLEDLGDAEESEDDSRVNTPVTSPLPDFDSRENISTDLNEPDNSGENQDNLVEVEASQGFDAELSVTAVENPEEPAMTENVPSSSIDTLAMIVNNTINTVTEPYISPSNPNQAPSQSTKTRKRKASPRHKDNPKKIRPYENVGDLEQSPAEISNRKSASPPLNINKFRMQFKSVLGQTMESAPRETGPVIADNPVLARLAQMTRQTFDRNLEIIEVKEEEDSDLTREASEAILEESEVKEEEIHITDILPEMDVVVNDQLVEQMFPSAPKGHRKKGPRCKQCPGCTRPDCGQCKNCKDKIKFGGDGHLKQACGLRVCDNHLQPTPAVSKDKVLAEISVENVSMESSSSNDKENDPLEIAPLSTDLSQQPVHVRNLIFSPPENKDELAPKESKTAATPEKCQIKTLSPCKNSSPIRRTNSAWNSDVKNMFSPSNPKSGSSKGGKVADEESAKPKDNSNKAAPPIQTITSSIPFTESVVRNLKTPITISKKFRIPIHMPMAGAKVVPISPSAIPPGSIVTPLPPGFKSAGFKAILSNSSRSLQAEIAQESAAPFNPPPVEEPPIAGPSNTEPAKSPAKPPNTMPIIETGETLLFKSDKLLSPPTQITEKKSPISKGNSGKSTTVASWDDKLRANIGEAEKDTSHITHRMQEKRGRRRSPRKRRQLDKPDSEEEFSDQDSLPEIDLCESNITPEAQNILDTFANRLLEQLEENVAKNVVVVPTSKEKKLFGKSDEKGKKKSCICCKMEKVVNRRKMGATETQTNKSQSDKETGLDQSETNDISVECKNQEASSVSVPKDEEVVPQPGPSSLVVTTPTFKTPKKSDSFQFKTPVKASLTTPQKASLLSPQTPRSRHIPASPLHQFSPRGSRLAIPLTPSRRSPSRTPTRSRHVSSLDTPVLNTDPDMAAPSLPTMAPVTPNCKNSPAPSYYTPSPSPRSQYSVPSPIQTPGLRFLQEEGERLSQSDDSMSPTKADQSNKRKTFRNLFKKSFAGRERELGSLLEQKISKYPFSTTNQTPLNSELLPQVEPFMSPAGQSSYDYTSSPQIVLGRPSPTEDPNHASFVSPNRTCYLSPTGMALSSTVLGFHQSPAHTDSDNTDLELEGEELSIIQSKDAVKVTVEAADDAAILDPEESIEAIQAHLAQSCPSSVTRCLSDESNTASLPHVAGARKPNVSDDILDRVSPEFPALHLSDDSETEDESMEVDSSTERKVASSETTTREIASKTFTPRKPRRVPLTTTARRSPLKNDSTNFELQHDANNLDKKLNEEAEHLLESDRLKKVRIPSSDRKEAMPISSRKSPRKRKSIKSPKSENKSKATSEPSVLKSSDSLTSDKTPPSKRQKVPEKAEFDEGKELSLMFSPIKQPGTTQPPAKSEPSNKPTDANPPYDLTSTNISPSQLPGVSVNIEKISLPAKMLAPDSPTKSISLPPTPESPMINAPSRSPTPTICKALGLQRSGSKPKGSEDTAIAKDLNRSWTQAIWGLDKLSGKKRVDKSSSFVGVGDGQDGQERRARRARKEEKSEDEEWTPEIIRTKAKTRGESNERNPGSKNPDQDADLVLMQLRMNKPKTVPRNRSTSVEKSKQGKGHTRSRSPPADKSFERRSRDPKRKTDQGSSKLEVKTSGKSGKCSNTEKASLESDKIRASSNKDRAALMEDLFSPKRTRSRDKSEKDESKDKLKSKSSDSKEEKSILPRQTRTSSRDKPRSGSKETSKSNEKDVTTSAVQLSPKLTRSRSGNLDNIPKAPIVKAVLDDKKQSENVKQESKENEIKARISASNPVQKKDGKTVPNILKKSPVKSQANEPSQGLEVEPNIIEELKAADERNTSVQIQPNEPAFVVSNSKFTTKDQSKGLSKQTKIMEPTKNNENTLDETEVITRAPLDINLLAEKSAMILSSLSNLETDKKLPAETEEVLPQPSSFEDSSCSTPILSRSSFFVFQNKLPFGVFEEDL